MEAAAALAHLAAGRQQGVGEAADLLLGLAQQMQGQALGRARPDPRQPLELLDQPGQWTRVAAQRCAAAVRNVGGAVSRMAVTPLPRPARIRPAMTPSRSLLPRPLFRGLVALLLAVSLVGCSAAAAGLNSFQSPDGRYAFLYPTGWTRVQVSGGPQVVFHDLIHSDETLSLVVSEVNPDNDLGDLGSAVAVGERLRRQVIAPEGSGRTAELLQADERQEGGRTFYDLEYAVHLQDRDRHELATVVVDRGRLYTFAASTNEIRWSKVNDLFHQVVTSFTLLV
jgi:photosystem II oxygen-evolving enhancer protein 2